MCEAGPADHGKIRKALWITQSFPEEIEADLARYYRLEFGLLFRPGSSLSWRRLLVLIDHLPPEAALNTAIRNSVPEETLAESAGDSAQARWSTMEGLTATLIDEIRQLEWMYASAHSDQKLQKPQPIRRPGVSSNRPRRRQVSLARAQKMDPRLRGLSEEEAQAKLDMLTGRGGEGA